jgi:hypothetical protein
MYTVGATVSAYRWGGGFFALCGFTLGGFSIGASNSGLARRRPPPAEDPDQGEDDEAQPEGQQEPLEPSTSEV